VDFVIKEGEFSVTGKVFILEGNVGKEREKSSTLSLKVSGDGNFSTEVLVLSAK